MGSLGPMGWNALQLESPSPNASNSWHELMVSTIGSRKLMKIVVHSEAVCGYRGKVGKDGVGTGLAMVSVCVFLFSPYVG